MPRTAITLPTISPRSCAALQRCELKIAGKPADMPSNRHEERYREFGIAAIGRARMIVATQDAEAAVNDCVDQYPERQFVRGQPVKNAGNKAYSHRDHCRFLARLKPARTMKKEF